jgi:phosphoesterase RecJ-like protein
MKLLEDHLETVKKIFEYPQNVVITTHINPDGDAMGSSMALANYLKQHGHNVQVIVPNDYPEFLKWMRGSSLVYTYDSSEKKCNEFIAQSTVIFCLDFNQLNRIESLGEKVAESTAVKILIDHHPDPYDFADYIYSDIESSSTSEMVYTFFEWFDNAEKLTKNIAESLFCGIMTDTGSFRFSSATAKTFYIAGKLIEAGADHTKIHREVMENYTAHRMNLLGYSIYEKLKVIEEFSTAFISLSYDELKRFNYQDGDTEGFVNYALSIEGIKFAAIFKEHEDQIRISFRSRDDFEANMFAKKHFNGGGHRYAAGGRTDESLDEAISRFVSLLPNYRNQLKRIKEEE